MKGEKPVTKNKGWCLTHLCVSAQSDPVIQVNHDIRLGPAVAAPPPAAPHLAVGPAAAQASLTAALLLSCSRRMRCNQGPSAVSVSSGDGSSGLASQCH